MPKKNWNVGDVVEVTCTCEIGNAGDLDATDDVLDVPGAMRLLRLGLQDCP